LLTIKPQPFNSLWVSAQSLQELGETFIRFQEYYESPNPDFHGKPFTLGSVKSYYSIKYGGDTYSDMWVGFNFPSSILQPFFNGLFDPLTEHEQEFLRLVKYRTDSYYIIGAQSRSVLRHELAHSMYSYCEDYRIEIDALIQKNKRKFGKVIQYMVGEGYSKKVVSDEIQAYVTDNDNHFILDNLDPILINSVNNIYQKHRRRCSNNEQ